jgi:hypothetical protein
MMRLLINARQAAANITLLADSSRQFHAHGCNLQLLGLENKKAARGGLLSDCQKADQR